TAGRPKVPGGSRSAAARPPFPRPRPELGLVFRSLRWLRRSLLPKYSATPSARSSVRRFPAPLIAHRLKVAASASALPPALPVVLGLSQLAEGMLRRRIAVR